MKHLLILLSLVLVACAPQTKGDNLNVSPEFSAYVTNFVNQSEKAGRPVTLKNLTIELDYSLPAPKGGNWILALCEQGSTQRKITINPKFWNNSWYSVAEREELLFHELGHCVLNRDHVTTRIGTIDQNIGAAVSIMYPYHLGEQEYTVNYDYYMKELFQTNPTPALYTYGVHGENRFDGNVYHALASMFEQNSTIETVAKEDESGHVSLKGLGCHEH